MHRYISALCALLLILTQAPETIGHMATKQNPPQPVSPLAWQMQRDIFRPKAIRLAVEYQEHTYNLCLEYGVDYEVMLKLMYHESCFLPDVTGHNTNGTYDVGLCQINSINHEWLLARGLDIYNPYDNIEAGVLILSMYTAKYPIEQALACYAAGEGGMARGEGYGRADEILAQEYF